MSLPTLDAWALHVGASLLVGMLAWTIGCALHGGLRISHVSRGYWLGVWALAVVPVGLAIALHYLGPANASWPLPAALPLPSVTELDVWPSALQAESLAVRASANTRTWLEPLLALLYLTGVSVATLRWGGGMLAVRRIVRTARPVDPTRMPGPLSAAEHRRLHHLGIVLRSTERSISPFAVCWPRQSIIMPAALMERLSDRQLHMVLRHEATHLTQHDPQRAGLMRMVGALFWFNPFLRLIASRIQVAAELRCDAAAAGVEKGARRAYAEAYLETLRLSARATIPASVAAFSRHDPGSHKLRISHMVHGDSRRRMHLALRITLSAMALVTGGAFAAVQIGAAKPANEHDARAAPHGSMTQERNGDDPVLEQTTIDVRQDIRFAFPVAKPRITGHYGDAGGPRKTPHRGMDFGAARGTPVYAPAAATVIAATTRYRDGPQYGTVVVLDHGNGWQSLYAHLEGFDVEVGQRVAAGAQIGRVGTTGKVTGPHVHLEMLLNGQRVDPEPLLQ